MRAAQTLAMGSYEHFSQIHSSVTEGTSSYTYFANALSILQPETPESIRQALCLGFVTSAGLGSESVVQNSRAALLDAIDHWPIESAMHPEQQRDADFSLLYLANCFLSLLKNEKTYDRITHMLEKGKPLRN